MFGLVITQVIGLTDMLQWGMRQSAELENQMTSVERVFDYINCPQESAFKSSPGSIDFIIFNIDIRHRISLFVEKPPKKWPQNGQITFQNLYLRYSLDSPYIIKNLNIRIESMEKVIFK